MTEVQKPKKWKIMLVSWLFVYPLINVMFAIVFPLVKEQHQLIKTLVFTLILVPIMGICLPLIHKRFWNWICNTPHLFAMEKNLKEHWETVYATKTPQEVSWTQEKPRISLDFIESFQLDKSASIIDIGGGDSLLVDFLLDLGYTNISVLDISAHAIERAKVRLGEKASLVSWIVSDINDFEPSQNYDLWHDRAAFHFLTNSKDIERYVKLVSNQAINLVVGTFSTNGPLKCSGLEISQYDEISLGELFAAEGFKRIETKREDHMTPFGTTQNFVFASFSKVINS